MTMQGTRELIAVACMGQLWCPDHSDYDDEDVAQGYVIEITQFDVDYATNYANWLVDGCCHGCGIEF